MHPLVIRGLAKIQAELQEQIMEAYELFDNRNKGCIDASALADAMKVLGYQIDKKQVQEMLALVSTGNRSTVTRDEFKKFMTARMDYRDDAEQLKSAFEYFDSGKRGKINNKDLVKVAEEIGQNVNQCPRIIIEADKDQDGALNEEQFLRVIKKTSYY